MPKLVDATADDSNHSPTRTASSPPVDERAVSVRDPARSPATRAHGKQLRWRGKLEKLTIGSLDHSKLTVVAQYNPKELQLDKQIPWKSADSLPGGNRPQRNEQDDVELTASPTRSITVELLFDGYEQHRSVQPEIDKLEELSSSQEPGSKHAEQRRPHHCVVTWGPTGMRPFRCVIESLVTKLTMFAPGGAPLRATCTVKLKEVNFLTKHRHRSAAASK